MYRPVFCFYPHFIKRSPSRTWTSCPRVISPGDGGKCAAGHRPAIHSGWKNRAQRHLGASAILQNERLRSLFLCKKGLWKNFSLFHSPIEYLVCSLVFSTSVSWEWNWKSTFHYSWKGDGLSSGKGLLLRLCGFSAKIWKNLILPLYKSFEVW